MTEEKLYKILVEGKSCHGSYFSWSLPSKTRPGKWHSVELPLVQCERGFHLTKDPKSWFVPGCQVFEVETKGEKLDYDSVYDKVCVQKVRLLKQLSETELEALNIFSSGEHEIKSGSCIAQGTAKVTAWNSSTVTARDSSTVTAFGSSTVTAFGSSTVTARDSSTVTARESSLIAIRGKYSKNVRIDLTEEAVCVDYREGKPAIRLA